ncbi:MAG: class IV adenylate cyclase [Minisyncoccia bacterium]|jgi:adenylate cyclase class 2
MREIEIKLKAKDLGALEQKLAALGCVLSASIHQHDVIYSKDGDTSVWEKMIEGAIVARIRRDDRGAIFTLKQQRTHEHDNIECETRLEDADAMHRALLLLGFVPGVEVKKTRRKGKLGEYEICLDQAEGLGDFVELEKMAEDDADAARISEDLYQKLESLGLSRADEEKRGYDMQMFQLGQK